MTQRTNDLPRFAKGPDDDGRIIGYVLMRLGCGDQWVYLGNTPGEIAEALANDLSGDEGTCFDELDTLTIEPRLFSAEELTKMPEFEGW